MRPIEPFNLREWTARAGRLFTCGRPGRGTFRRAKRPIGEDTIDRWVEGLPTGEVLHLVSLLGCKRGGYSEFGYYPFRSTGEDGTKPTFQEWFDQRYGPRFEIHEFPTVDAEEISPAVLVAAKERVLSLLASQKVVVLVDSAGAVRAATVCEACGSKSMSPQTE